MTIRKTLRIIVAALPALALFTSCMKTATADEQNTVKKGKLRKSTAYENGSLVSYTLYHYDQDKLVKKETFFPKGSSYYLNSYDSMIYENTRLKTIRNHRFNTIISQTELFARTEFIYSGTKIYEEKFIYDSAGVKTLPFTVKGYAYNSADQLVGFIERLMDGTIRSVTTYDLNPGGTIRAERYTHNSGNRLPHTSNYSYQNNQISRIENFYSGAKVYDINFTADAVTGNVTEQNKIYTPGGRTEKTVYEYN